ncbi:Asp-tRNA(Asn)/Glu-tRNA(Gln) amidotransferase subunit GatB [Pararhodospirillum photometricum]|uniref:Aspartyl/glutamyl-tRNA(Asn/Gln) amidotransferase subunit B n=1 Tax=Pararhodospirillum photometricum DSM 122 TaxID=1150469 RepID=H6SIN7_PARPM|nr:Asp-tRNA(Asn)/Glu-tRNA(Gln) amidotransferase subunit GatB [Pararhodospirillum photometricum]CCG06664.1 Aspartyl/glutamyl-tRNA(Asn/Gln) amidotransferase subunit B [Pararhodospirillum photometricum DSM 122]
MVYRIEGSTGFWEVVIGLEVHAQVVSQSKLFSGASTRFGAEPNTQVSLVDAALPGMLPVINGYCVEQAVRTGLALRAKINKHSIFARKNYFYADLPQGYQISQYEQPIVGEGRLVLDMPDGSSRTVGIERLHLEQDAGKSMHDQHPTRSLIDLNRAGVALMEIVSRPDMREPEEAGAYLRKLRSILRYLGTCDGNMEEGSMRADVNVSVRREGETALRTRCEVKNVNSVRFVMQAIETEARRQVMVWESGDEVKQETRLFDPAKGETRSMRSKEHAHDYRYFPDPDLLPLEFDDDFVNRVRDTLPELPDDKKERFIADYGLTPYDASVLVVDRDNADFFEAVATGRDGKLAANWVINNLFGALAKAGRAVADSPVSAAHLGELLDLLRDEVINGRIAKDVFEIMMETGSAPGQIVEERGLTQVTDTSAIEAAVDAVIAANPDKANEVRGGKDKLLGWFVGQVMKTTGGKANPALVNDILKGRLLG